MKERDDHELIKKKIKLFFDTKKFIHLNLKSGKFQNGSVVSLDSADFFTFFDRFEGELPIFYLEVKDVRLFTTKKEDGDGRQT